VHLLHLFPAIDLPQLRVAQSQQAKEQQQHGVLARQARLRLGAATTFAVDPLEGKVVRAASRRGVSTDVLIREAIEPAVDYDDWFIREVEKGLGQVDASRR
jgi:predicted transcriptional regulator